MTSASDGRLRWIIITGRDACLAALLVLLATPAAAEPSPDQIRELIVRLATLRQVTEFCTDEMWRGSEGAFCSRQKEIMTSSLTNEIKAAIETEEYFFDALAKGEVGDAYTVNSQNLALPGAVTRISRDIMTSLDTQSTLRADQAR